MINLTKENIEELFTKTEELEEVEKLASELLRIAQDRYKDVKVELEREGKKTEIEQKHLWTEVFNLGTNCQAGQALKVYHPEVFEAYEKQNQKAKDLQNYCMMTFGIDYKNMRIADYLKLMQAVARYENNNK